MSLRKLLSGGQAIELLAQDGDRKRFRFRTPMGQTPDCCFSFAGLRNQVTLLIQKQEVEEGVEEGTVLSCVNDIAAATQHTLTSHLAKRTHRAVLFCRANRLLPSQNPTLSGGVPSNQYICKALAVVAKATGLRLLCPPARFCTHNGAMVACNRMERLREGTGTLAPEVEVEVSYEPRAPLGVDITAEVRDAAIRPPPIRIKIPA
uniref:O-sialoglycoprotein endopeptidase-like 1 n=1 Tax=Xiphophorus maculatus TaxID=8083 RepID=A0A3B5R6D4_XIPMA